jgi:hypothetical protein
MEPLKGDIQDAAAGNIRSFGIHHVTDAAHPDIFTALPGQRTNRLEILFFIDAHHAGDNNNHSTAPFIM